MDGSKGFTPRLVSCLMLIAAVISLVAATSEPAAPADTEGDRISSFADQYAVPPPGGHTSSSFADQYGDSQSFPSAFADQYAPDPSLPICEKLAHDLGEAAQVSPFSPKWYKWLTGKYGDPALPTDVANGYRYCWKCRAECNGNWKEESCSLWTDHKWNVKEWTYPTCTSSSPPPDKPRYEPPRTPAKTPSQAEIQAIKERAGRGDAEAQYKLGLLYRDGLGVPKDFQQAGEWFSKAAMGGNKDAKRELER